MANDVIMSVSVLPKYGDEMNGKFREIRVYKGLISYPIFGLD